MIIGPPKKITFLGLPIVTDSTLKKNEIRIKQFLNIDNWICPTCGSTVFGRTLFCPFNKDKGPQCLTPKPI
jgi:hypothetical protein